jgi:hypothetical protein
MAKLTSHPSAGRTSEAPHKRAATARPHLLLAGAALALTGAATGATPTEQMEFFEKKVRPLLVDKCYNCHSPEHKVKGGLRLDTREGWVTGGDSGPALLPHQPETSLFMSAVGYTNRDLKMPPKQKLSDEEIAVFRDWIAMGAPDPRTGAPEVAAKTASKAMSMEDGRKFWAFVPPVKPALPAVKDSAWPATDADHFVLAGLESAGLEHADDAPLEVLARRLYFDLTGMPPTTAELHEFQQMAGQTQVAALASYGAIVDRLLSSPRFGERWGRHWLDLARFAESSGGGRTLPFKDAWRYRDYVIESLNQDMPLDRFISEQLAGDLLPAATSAERRRQLTATGFLVLGPTNYEEQDKQLLRMDIVDEQMDTMGRAFLGMTLSCARCHDHKFDPIPASDYYALAGIFRSTRTLKNYKDNVAHWIDTPLPMEGEVETRLQAHETRLEKLTADVAAAKKRIKKLSPKVEAKDAKARPVAPDELPGVVVDDSQATVVGTWKTSTRYPTYVGEGYLHDQNEDKGAKTLTFTPKVPQDGRYEVWLSYTALNDRADNVPVTILHADGEETVRVDERAEPTINGRFVSLGQYRFVAGGEGYVLVSNDGTNGIVTADAVVFVPLDELAKLQTATAPAGADSTAAGNTQLQAAQAQLKDLEKELKQLQASPLARPEAMTVQDDSEPEDCKIHVRGSIRNLGAEVPRGFLTVAQHGPAPKIPDAESGRRQLAEWVANRNNPLTARVLVNRTWMWLHGEGLVRTVDNFGTTGEKPTHPELLDALAVEFMEDGCSLKRLVKRLVMGRTYRMASTGPEASLQADPDNRHWWRQNRRRMDAESIRDSILAMSGQLDPKVGGPNVKADAIDSNSGAAQNLEYNYVFTDVRRSVYTPAFRNKRLELFETFDFADINQPLGRRSSSTVAPQALYFLNHPFMVEQSRLAAQRLIASGGDDDGLVRQAYREILARPPGPRELRLALDFVTVSASEQDAEARRFDNWSLLIQTLFASVDFRYLN